MQKPSLGWQSWSPPLPRWHKLPRWDYSPFPYDQANIPLVSRRKLKTNISYWCSWYAYGTKITDYKIQNTIRIIKRHRLAFTHILIDDGWCTWGDWLTPTSAKFPDFKNTVKHIKQQGYLVGLWLAPFLADQSSILFRQHPDWFTYHQNQPIQGLNMVPLINSFVPQRYLLNYELPAVKNYIQACLKQVILGWGVNLLKLDFLYAPYFDPNQTTSRIPRQNLRWLLSHIYRTYPQVTTIACGTPLADSAGLVDVVRVCKDTAWPGDTPRWLNKLVYASRVKLLDQTLHVPRSPSLNLDPDVRMFSLDNRAITQFWELFHNTIVGVGDNLSRLNTKQLNLLKNWLVTNQLFYTRF